MSDYQELKMKYEKLKEERDKYKYCVEQLKNCLIKAWEFNYYMKNEIEKMKKVVSEVDSDE